MTHNHLLTLISKPVPAALRLVMIIPLMFAFAACGKSGHEGLKPAVPQAEVGTDRVSFPKDSPQLATLKVVNAVLEQDNFIRINGRAAWNDARTSRVSSPVNGRVVELIATPGMQVKKGALLAVISSPEFGTIQAEARRAESELQLQ